MAPSPGPDAPGDPAVADPHREVGRFVRLPRPGRAVGDKVEGEVLGGVDLDVPVLGLDLGRLHGVDCGRAPPKSRLTLVRHFILDVECGGPPKVESDSKSDTVANGKAHP